MPPFLTNCSLKYLARPLRVVALRVGEDGDFFGLEGLVGEVRHHGALERIDEADAENVVAHLGDLRVGGGRGNHRDFRRLGDRRGFERAAGGHLAEDGDDAVAGDQFVDDVGGLAGLGLVVLGEEFDLFAEHAAGGVDFLDRQFGALVGRGAECRFFPGERGEFADLDGVTASGFAARERNQAEERGGGGENQVGRFHAGTIGERSAEFRKPPYRVQQHIACPEMKIEGTANLANSANSGKFAPLKSS